MHGVNVDFLFPNERSANWLGEGLAEAVHFVSPYPEGDHLGSGHGSARSDY